MDANALSAFVLDSITDLGIYLVDPDGKIASWNKGAERWLGYTEEDALGRSASVLYADDEPAAGAAKSPDARGATRALAHADAWFRRKDGALLAASISRHPVYDRAGEPLGTCHVLAPLREHGNGNDNLRERHFTDEQFRILVQGVVDYAIYMLDLDGRVHTWNAGAERTKGYTADDIIGRHFSVFYTEEDRRAGEPERGLSHALEHGRFETKAWRVRKDGSLYWAHVVIDRIDDDHGRPIGFAKIIRDATEIRRAEEAMEQMRAALHQAQKMEAIGQLTGGIAHDFNNILQVITGNLHLLSEDVAGNERACKRVANAMAGVERGSTLASQLLAFGRRQPLEPRVLNPGRLVRGMDELLRRTLGEGVEVETVVAGGLWNASIDPTNLESALLNLAINARDAMDGRGKLTIEAGNAYLDDRYARAHHEVTAGQYVLIAVTDTGCGMSPETIEKVFEPFFSTKPEGSGTGLGLSMVYGFVKQSGGHVKIYSELGHGTTVKLYLPRSTEPEHERSLEIPAQAEGGSEAILVVEDDEAVREASVALLRNLGYTVYQAADAQAALSIIESGIALDMLFTDVVMPGAMRSPELARRARERMPHLAVLFTSGYTENAIVHAGRLDEGVQLLSKPYTNEALARKVRQVLFEGQRGRHDRLAPPRTPVSAAAVTPAGTAEPAEPAIPAAPVTPAAATVPALRLMLCEDNALIRTVVQDILESRGFDVTVAGTAEDAIGLWDAGTRVDLLVTDVNLPGAPGIELAGALRQRMPALPVIFATGDAEHAPPATDARTAILVKPYDAEKLIAVIEALTVNTRDGG